MARKRQISPSIWTSEQFCSLKDLGARLLFIGIFSNADDEGRLKASPWHLKMLIYPSDENIIVENVAKWLDELSTVNLITVYKVFDVEYLFIPTFSKHQFISKPFPSNIPEPFPNRSRTVPVHTNINIIKETFINNIDNEYLIDIDNDNSDNGSKTWKTEIAGVGGEIFDMPTLWLQATKIIKKNVSQSVYQTWFARMSVYGVNGNVLLFYVKSSYHLENAQKFEFILSKAVYDVTGIKYSIRFAIDSDPDSVYRFSEAVDAICESYNVSHEDIMSQKRDALLVNARRELCRSMMATGRFSVAELGRRLGKDRTTILHMLKDKEQIT